LLVVDGSHSVDIRLNNLGIEHVFETWEGQNHVPEVGTSSAALAYYDSALVITRNFLVHYICGDSLQSGYTTNVAVNNLAPLPSLIGVFPNPATDAFTIQSDRLAGTGYIMDLYSSTGALVKSVPLSSSGQTTVSTNGLPAGMYFMNIHNADVSYSRKILVQ
ncbi:MAG TPA: T9SS type A sorting domain-containing protein, partial [Bacteroidia bacterium]|nr:T9SS type A sorting domain-containing protein [Bacteroidia bacterium]